MRFLRLRASEIAPWVPGLKALEAGIRYPLGGGEEFTLDHGPDYAPFFSGLGDAYFLLAIEGETVVGSIAGILKPADFAGRILTTLYLCDLKVAPTHRGGRLTHPMLLRGLVEIPKVRASWKTRLLYGAGMRGDRGDVMRTARGANPLRMGSPYAVLDVFFVPAGQLRALEPSGAPAPPSTPGLDLSLGLEDAPGGFTTTAGRKDLRRVSTGAPLPLWHLTRAPSAWGSSLGQMLKASAEAILAADDATVCFTLDRRLTEAGLWLDSRGIRTETRCTVYALPLPGGPRSPAWVHLSPAEI